MPRCMTLNNFSFLRNKYYCTHRIFFYDLINLFYLSREHQNIKGIKHLFAADCNMANVVDMESNMFPLVE